MTQQEHHFETMVKRELDYLLYLPKDYAIDNERSWPLILFLHGSGERGDDIELVKMHGLPKILDDQPDFPFVVISPQCPENSWWSIEMDALKALLDHILATYAVDPDRVYLTGLSMGGFGAWSMGIAYPDTFASVVPICGGGDPGKVCALKDVPVWVFHGDMDKSVRVSESKKMVKTLKACGGDVQLTVYPGVGHDSWTQTYDNPGLYDWLLSHKRSPEDV
jgi:predicted peptidase